MTTTRVDSQPAADLRIGDVARRAGVSVRALHHYDALGLVSPSTRTAAGHRLYSTEDIARLHTVRTLQRLGLPLAAIGEWLAAGAASLGTLELHLEHVREQRASLGLLERRLDAMVEQLRRGTPLSITQLIDSLEAMRMTEQYYTPEQRAQLEQRRLELGEEHIREVEAEWPRLIDALRAARDRGVAPDDAELAPLLQRWQELIAEFTGGGPGVERSLRTMYRDRPDTAQQHGVNLDAELMAYVGRAMQAQRPGG